MDRTPFALAVASLILQALTFLSPPSPAPIRTEVTVTLQVPATAPTCIWATPPGGYSGPVRVTSW
jgi:hypothetical protein